jgi:hypothetical protein
MVADTASVRPAPQQPCCILLGRAGWYTLRSQTFRHRASGEPSGSDHTTAINVAVTTEAPLVAVFAFGVRRGVVHESDPTWQCEIFKGLKNNQEAQRDGGAGPRSTNHFPKRGRRLS